MKTTLTILTLVFAFFIFSLPETADAARLGGGRSFGAKPFMSNPAPNIFHQTPPAAQGQAQRQATATAGQPRTGMFGGMGGLFGGLLAGTLIGSLLAGHGFAGGGMMDILILGLLIYLALKLFARMRSRPAEATAGAADSVHQYTRLEDNSNSAGWDRLRDTGGASSPQGAAASSLPDDFDAEEFLRGAKMVYNRLQNSWDKRDLNDIAEFATPAVMQTVREQMEADPTPSTTEVLLVNAHVLDVERDGDSQRAQAFFDVLLREDKNQETPSTVREIWHFVRPITNGNWQLDGIQQVGHG
ncbi:MAG: 39S ribosomal protein L45 [Desulfovibrio sp.]|jgi:predicted lipid-binding transport protein (Tim44 family)|nr:39S ribosomal protein L45 [Desulfovibrio sp.]